MMDDLISRRDAINAVSEITTTMSVCTNKDECYGMKRMQKQAITELENMPSAEQEAPDINVGNIGTISRQVAIDMFDEQIELCNASLHKGVPEKDAYAIKVERASLMAYREKLECPPFVQPERKMGRWLPDNTDYYRTRFICSVCGESEEVPTTGFGYGPMWNYCPMCGAKMEEGREDG